MAAQQSPKARRRSPEIVLRDGQPAAVILDIEDYQDMLERLQDLDDLEILKQMREKPLMGTSISRSISVFQDFDLDQRNRAGHGLRRGLTARYAQLRCGTRPKSSSGTVPG